MARLFIIADDLSGAAETAVQFVHRGVPALVALSLENGGLTALGKSSPVVALDTETRHASPEAAKAAVKNAAFTASRRGFTHIYKKTDSTLRGNIGVELAALMEVIKQEYMVFVPAYPRAGRYTRDGLQWIGDRLLHESTIAKDPLDPVTTSSVAEIIKRQASLPVVPVRPETLGTSISEGRKGILVCDASTDGDLANIADVLEQHNALRFIAGPAAFAGLLAKRLNLPVGLPARPSLDSTLLIVNGSLHEKSLVQVAYALERGACGIQVPPRIALSEQISEHIPALQAYAAGATGRDIALYTVLDRAQHADYMKYGNEYGLSKREVHQRISMNMARIGAALACAHSSVLCSFGGDVAIALLRVLGCDRLQPLAEGTPGVVLSRVSGGNNALYFITKPGAFGSVKVVDDIKILMQGAGNAR